MAACFASSAVFAGGAYRAPAGERAPVRGPNGASILPGGRVIQPLGHQFPTGPGPFGMSVNASGTSLVTANLGPERSSVTILRADRKGNWALQNILTPRPATPENSFHSLFNGIALSSGKQIWLSEGESGTVGLMDL